MLPIRGTPWWLGVILGLVFVGPTPAEDRHIVDVLGIFSPPVRDEAERRLEKLLATCQKKVVIETVSHLDEEEAEEFQELRRDRDRVRFFRDLATIWAEARDLDGVYVLLCKEPAGHAVAVWPPENDAYFPRDDQRQLDQIFANVRSLSPTYDEALLEAVRLLEATLQANTRTQAAAPVRDGFRWTMALWALGGLLAAWAAAGVLRTRTAARQGDAGAQPPGASASVLSGPAAGYWLTQVFFGKESRPAVATPAPEVAVVAVVSEPAPFSEGEPSTPTEAV